MRYGVPLLLLLGVLLAGCAQAQARGGEWVPVESRGAWKGAPPLTDEALTRREHASGCASAVIAGGVGGGPLVAMFAVAAMTLGIAYPWSVMATRPWYLQSPIVESASGRLDAS